MSDKNTVPPYTNRGAQNTSEEGLRACLDWLQVTFLGTSNPLDVIVILGMQESDFETKEIGKFGYKFHMRNGHIAIYYSDDLPHCHLEITGQGCREYEARKLFDWTELLGMILMLEGINITRLDLAVDDFKGYFKIQTLYQKLRRAHARSKFKTYRYMTKGKISEREVSGHTVYLGDPSSRLMVRFYDKLLERISKGVEVEEGLTCWNRTEIQLRDERAKMAALMIATESENIGSLIAGLLRNYINFVNPKKNKNGEIDSNKSRWPISDFWLAFTNAAEPIKLTQVAPDRTIEQTKEWYEKQMTPTMALLLEAYGNNPDMVNKWIKEGSERYSDKHKEMLKRFREEQTIKEEVLKERRKEMKKKLLKSRKLNVKKEQSENTELS
jgi:phage replication initiation protein